MANARGPRGRRCTNSGNASARSFSILPGSRCSLGWSGSDSRPCIRPPPHGQIGSPFSFNKWLMRAGGKEVKGRFPLKRALTSPAGERKAAENCRSLPIGIGTGATFGRSGPFHELEVFSRWLQTPEECHVYGRRQDLHFLFCSLRALREGSRKQNESSIRSAFL
jgi:hypothetical protein